MRRLCFLAILCVVSSAAAEYNEEGAVDGPAPEGPDVFAAVRCAVARVDPPRFMLGSALGLVGGKVVKLCAMGVFKGALLVYLVSFLPGLLTDVGQPEWGAAAAELEAWFKAQAKAVEAAFRSLFRLARVECRLDGLARNVEAWVKENGSISSGVAAGFFAGIYA